MNATGKRHDPLAGAAVLLAAVAFAGSFVHVQRTVADHGQPGWLSWAIAAMPELSVLLAVLRVRRDGARQAWPWIVGGTAAGFTLSANLAQAEPTIWGWVVAGWPAWAALGAAALVELGGADDQDRSTPSASPRPARSTPIALTAHPARSIAWSAPARSIDPRPIAPIEATLRSIEGVRSVPAATRSIGPRSTVTVPDPIDPDPPIVDSIGPDSSPALDRPRSGPDRPTPIDPPRAWSAPADRPEPAWVSRSTLAPGRGSGRSLAELTADLDAALGPDEPVPSAEAIRRHYGIGAPRNRELRDAVTNVRRQRAAGGVEGEIT